MRIRSLAATSGLVALLAACSSTSTNPAGTGGNGAGGGSGGSAGDAAASGATIHCGKQSCDPQNTLCCFDPTTFTSECVAPGACNADHYPYACDSTSDCVAANKPGTVCCAYVAFDNIKSSSCVAACNAPMEQLCDQSANECGSCIQSPHPPSYFFTCQ